MSLKCIFPPSKSRNPSRKAMRMGPERSGAVMSSRSASPKDTIEMSLRFISSISMPMSALLTYYLRAKEDRRTRQAQAALAA